MKLSSLKWGWIIGIALLAKAIMLPLTYLYMVVYSYGIHPGENAEFYETYVFENRAWIASVMSLIVYFFLAWWMGRKVKTQIIAHVMMICVLGIFVSYTLELIAGDIRNYVVPLIIANLMPFIGAWLGGKKAEADLG